MTKKDFKRLPSSILPKLYDITIRPDLVECKFKGTVVIDLEIKESVSTIKLNCAALTLSEISLEQNSDTCAPTSTDFEKDEEVVSFTFNKPLEKGNGRLKIGFQGPLEDKLKGLYRTKYTVDGKTKYGAATQFEAADARRCFPCWDEPAIKARFDIMLIVPSDLIALSNMPEVSRKPFEEDSSLSIVKYSTTPLMSTYLLAIVVGEFDCVEQAVEGVTVRVFTPVGKKEQGTFPLEVATNALSFYNKYFKIIYPLPKLDLVALPDFLVGAMENWGLITYRERALLVDPLNTSFIVKQTNSLIIAHEIAHQWFGNLVTMEWWTHLWLNEGYATFTEFLAINDVYPDFQVWTQFNVDNFIPALELDCLNSSHPIEVPVRSPAEVEEVFDNISYLKGASVIRMLHDFLGSEGFKAGMNLYLTRHQYGNTFTEDLWKALEDSSGKPVRSMMSGWTKQTGYPLITVSQGSDDPNVLNFKQERFLLDQSKGSVGLWCVPISISSSSSPEKPIKEFLLDAQMGQVIIDVANESWIKVNAGSVGFFRTKYSEEMLPRLYSAIASKELPPTDRLNIVDDLFALAQAGYNSTVETLKLLLAYQEENSHIVWFAVCNCLGKLDSLLSHTSYHELFQSYSRKLLQSIVKKVGWDPKPNEDNPDKMLRSRIIGALGFFGDEAIIAEAKKKLAAHISGADIIPADNRSCVFRTVASVADEATFDQMIKLYNDAEDQEEKVRLAVSLGFTRDPKLIQRVLDFAMSSAVRKQDTNHVLSPLAYSKFGMDSLWAFIKANIKEFKARYEGTGLIIFLIKSSLDNFASTEVADDIEAFFKQNPVQSTERAILQCTEAVRLNAAWLARDSQNIHKFLADFE